MRTRLFRYKTELSLIFGLLLFFWITSESEATLKSSLPFILFWFLLLLLNRFSHKVSLSLALIFLVLTAVMTTLEDVVVANKLALWVYIFFITGLLQQILDPVIACLAGRRARIPMYVGGRSNLKEHSSDETKA